MTDKSKGLKWILLYGITGIVDLIQIILTFTGIGIAVSEALEAVMPFFLIGVFQFLFKISLISHPSRLLSIVGATGFDAITGGIAPFWIIDVWYIQRTVKKEEAEINALKQTELLKNNIRKPLYEGGIRQPRKIEQTTISGPINTGGVRPPNGGLTT